MQFIILSAMEVLKSTLIDYIPMLRVLSEPSIVREVNHLFNSSTEPMPADTRRLNVIGDIAVLVWSQRPEYVIKIKIPSSFTTHTYYYTNEGRAPVEENSLELRVRVSLQMRKIIEVEDLDRLYVPKKWSFSHGVIAEKLDLLSWDETGRRIEAMTMDEQKNVATQIWKLIYLTGNQDLSRNFLMMDDGRLAFYDTEPYGTTLEKVEKLRPRATANFLSETLFDRQLKLEVIQDFFK
jgi:hypothetical protein